MRKEKRQKNNMIHGKRIPLNESSKNKKNFVISFLLKTMFNFFLDIIFDIEFHLILLLSTVSFPHCCRAK